MHKYVGQKIDVSLSLTLKNQSINKNLLIRSSRCFLGKIIVTEMRNLENVERTFRLKCRTLWRREERKFG